MNLRNNENLVRLRKVRKSFVVSRQLDRYVMHTMGELGELKKDSYINVAISKYSSARHSRR